MTDGSWCVGDAPHHVTLNFLTAPGMGPRPLNAGRTVLFPSPTLGDGITVTFLTGQCLRSTWDGTPHPGQSLTLIQTGTPPLALMHLYYAKDWIPTIGPQFPELHIMPQDNKEQNEDHKTPSIIIVENDDRISITIPNHHSWNLKCFNWHENASR